MNLPSTESRENEVDASIASCHLHQCCEFLVTWPCRSNDTSWRRVGESHGREFTTLMKMLEAIKTSTSFSFDTVEGKFIIVMDPESSNTHQELIVFYVANKFIFKNSASACWWHTKKLLVYIPGFRIHNNDEFTFNGIDSVEGKFIIIMVPVSRNTHQYLISKKLWMYRTLPVYQVYRQINVLTLV